MVFPAKAACCLQIPPWLIPSILIMLVRKKRGKRLIFTRLLGANKESSTNLWLNRFTAISLIDIKSITYANGLTWHSSAQETCHFAPEGATLIGSIE